MTRQVVCLWTCLLFLSFSFSLNLQAEDSFEVSAIENKRRTADQLSFTIKFNRATGKAKIAPVARPKFSFEVTYSYLEGSNKTITIQDAEQPLETGSKLFFVTNLTSIDTIQGFYNVSIKKDSRYQTTQADPKSIADMGTISIVMKYNNNPIDNSQTITFEIDKNVKYNLGNEAFEKNLVVAPQFKEVLLQMPGSKDKILLFKDKENTVEDTVETQTLSSQAMDLILFDLDGIDNQDSYIATSSKPTDPKKGFVISSRFLDLEDNTGVKIKKATNEEWKTFIKNKLESSQKEKCYFIFPPANLDVKKSYECIRCNFADSVETSKDQAYLIESSSFSEGSNTIVKKFTSRDVSKGQSFQDLENGRRYAVLPLFSSNTMIHYTKPKDPTANQESKIMCQIISAEENYTLADFLNSNNEFDKGDPRCFIVSAAYGSAFEPQVDIFRWLRDHVILKTSLGQEFMDFYYNNSEPVANFIATSEVLKFSVRTILWPFAIGVYVLKFLVDTPSFLLFLSFSFLAFFVFRNVFIKKT